MAIDGAWEEQHQIDGIQENQDVAWGSCSGAFPNSNKLFSSSSLSKRAFCDKCLALFISTRESLALGLLTKFLLDESSNLDLSIFCLGLTTALYSCNALLTGRIFSSLSLLSFKSDTWLKSSGFLMTGFD